jgi:hypothetical protein
MDPIKVCGFTFIKNAVKLDFPVVEAIMSALPLCDEFVVVVGDCDDGTRLLIESIESDKIRIIDSVWDMSMKEGGRVYALETDKAFQAVGPEFDWCVYIQADEAMHEKDFPVIRAAMSKWKNDQAVEGLLFNYNHFYGSYDYIGNTRKWYRNEIRIIRNDKTINSYRDAQGFRKEGRKLNVVSIDAGIYHYGWVRPPAFMQAKINLTKEYYTGQSNQSTVYEFDYDHNFDSLKRFEGTHPAAMQKRIDQRNWQINIDTSRIKMNFRYKFLFYFEKIFGVRLFEYQNYTVLPKK